MADGIADYAENFTVARKLFDSIKVMKFGDGRLPCGALCPAPERSESERRAARQRQSARHQSRQSHRQRDQRLFALRMFDQFKDAQAIADAIRLSDDLDHG